MICSPARIAANRANALKSTGPRTPEGKARSRANALKHGLTGEGIALPDEDLAEVSLRFAEFEAELQPSGPLGRALTRRAAMLTVRLERCERQDAAALSTRVRHAKDDHDRARRIEAAALLGSIADDPASTALQLLATAEGVEAAVDAWLDLRADLARGDDPRRWTAAHDERAHHLTGRRMDEVPVSRIMELSCAIRGDFGLLSPSEGAGLDDEGRREWARGRLIELIDAEVEALRSCGEAVAEEAELDREEAAARALFDPSKEAILARRYEAATERGLYRAIKEFRQVEREAAERPAAILDEPLGSFGIADEGPTEAPIPPRRSLPTIPPRAVSARELPVEAPELASAGAVGLDPGR